MFEPGDTFKLNVVTVVIAAGFFGYVLLLAPGPEPATSGGATPFVLVTPTSTGPTSRIAEQPIGVTASPSVVPSATATPDPTSTDTPTLSPSRTPTSTVETPTVTPTSTPATQHTVAPGEVLSTIAARYGVTVEAIVAANELADPNRLEVGQVLVIPKP